MGKPTLSDFGGSNYPKRRKQNLVKANVLSFRCRDCLTLRYVLPRELMRAARPRCLGCGGPLEETEASHKRHLEKMDSVRAVRCGERLPAQIRSPKKLPKCLSCGTVYPDGLGLCGHLRRNPSCRQSYVIEGWWGEYDGMRVLQGTGFAFQLIPDDPWLVTFLSIDGEETTVRVRSKRGATKKVREIAGLQMLQNGT